jgi:hypothetical protein
MDRCDQQTGCCRVMRSGFGWAALWLMHLLPDAFSCSDFIGRVHRPHSGCASGGC